jgi:hypothetical protein
MEPPNKFVLQPSVAERRACPQDCSEQRRRAQGERSSAVARVQSKRRMAIVPAALLCAMIMWSHETLVAQTPAASPAPVPTAGTAPAPSVEPDGITRDGYQIHSSVELGYRSTDVTGSGDMYDTLVNLQTGPRILDQTLTMLSVDHQGLLFDNLYLNSVGWGGDPNNYLRLRADKSKWYNLQGSFRRDQYFSDYDLLANPLNPPTSTPSVPILTSPHEFDTTRRMSDIDLMLLPQSVVSFRLGYSHNNMTGPSYSSIHEGTEASLLQDWNTTMNSYSVGADLRIAPRTVLSYDQFLDYYKGDTDYQLNPINEALLPTTPVSSVSLGLSFDTANKEPCAVPAGQNGLIVNGTLTNVTCSAYSSYSRDQRIRTSTPTERISLRSDYFRKLEVVGSFSYSSAVSSTPLDESFSGLITRTNTLAFIGSGTAAANRISDAVDLGATLHLTQHLRLIEKFYFWAYRIPQNGNLNELDYICAAPPCTLLSTPLPTPVATPTSIQSSFNQTWTRNQAELAWDISKKVGARIGYRYGDRDFNHFNDFLPGDLDHFVGLEKTALLGFWARPTHALRFNFDLEHTNYNAVFVRLSPRKDARYRFQTTYTPGSWATLGGSINIRQESNGDVQTQFVGHNQNYGLTASLAPREHFGLDLAYNFNSVIQNAIICFNDTPPTGVILPFVANANNNDCAGNDTSNNLMANSYYTNHTNFGMATFRFKPAKRVMANVGYSITSVDGNAPQFNLLQPLGTLQYKYQQPVANLSVDIARKWAFNMGWNYYEYGEGSFVGPTAPRYFHANSLTESLRYAF